MNVFSVMSEAVAKVAAQVNKKREDQIISALKDKGYSFNDKKEMELFLKKRAELKVIPHHKRSILFIDGIVLCEWSDELKVDVRGDKIIVTVG